MDYSSESRRNRRKPYSVSKRTFSYRTPRELKEILDYSVIGQERAKKAICVAFSNHLKRIIILEEERYPTVNIDKSNLLFSFSLRSFCNVDSKIASAASDNS